jgi:GDP-L-fucose synthase
MILHSEKPGASHPPLDLRDKRVLLTGASGFLGRHLQEALAEKGIRPLAVGSTDYDLTEQREVRRLYAERAPQVVIHAAGLVGGILANRERPAEFFTVNLLMNTMMLHEAWKAGVEKFVSLIGGCSYPQHAPSPIREEALWDGYPQPESAPYSIAKKMLVVQSEAYRRQHGLDAIVLVPGNLYGPYDNFHLENSHVIPALIRKAYEARRDGRRVFTAWGSGAPVRDFIYAGDAARAIVLAAERYSGDGIINISSGVPTTIRELVETVFRLTGFEGELVWDTSKPDGQMYKAFEVTRMRTVLGFEPAISLEEGLRRTIDWFARNQQTARL